MKAVCKISLKLLLNSNDINEQNNNLICNKNKNSMNNLHREKLNIINEEIEIFSEEEQKLKIEKLISKGLKTNRSRGRFIFANTITKKKIYKEKNNGCT